MTDIPLPPAVVEAAARALAIENEGSDKWWTLHMRKATAALRAGLGAWPGMIDGCTWKNQPPTIILPLTENSNGK